VGAVSAGDGKREGEAGETSSVRVVGVDLMPLMVQTSRAVLAAAGLGADVGASGGGGGGGGSGSGDENDGASGSGGASPVRFVLGDAAALPAEMLGHAALVVLTSLAWGERLRRRVYARLLDSLPLDALVCDYLPAPAELAPDLDPHATSSSVPAATGARQRSLRALVENTVETSWAQRQPMFVSKVIVL